MSSGAADRRMIQPAPLFFGSVKFPWKVAPGASATTSPGWAEFRAGSFAQKVACTMCQERPAGEPGVGL